MRADHTPGRHHPRKRMIQYSRALVMDREAAAYWIPRFRGVRRLGVERLRRHDLDPLARNDDRDGVPPSNLNRLARIRHRGGETAVDRDRLAVDVRCVVAGEE